MADKKITVLGDTADESLTPEEEHKLEVKIDKMLDLHQPDAVATPERSKKSDTEPKIEKKNKEILPVDDAEPAELPEISKHEGAALAPLEVPEPPQPPEAVKT